MPAISSTALREAIERHARYSLAERWQNLSPRQVFQCVGLAVRDLLVDARGETERRHREDDMARVARVWPGDDARLARMSLFEEGDVKQLRMAHLSIVGSHSVNGVSALHSRLVQTTLAPDFCAMWPERFNNKTNGVTPRRWLVQANRLLSNLITTTIGDQWITDLERLTALAMCAAC